MFWIYLISGNYIVKFLIQISQTKTELRQQRTVHLTLFSSESNSEGEIIRENQIHRICDICLVTYQSGFLWQKVFVKKQVHAETNDNWPSIPARNIYTGLALIECLKFSEFVDLHIFTSGKQQGVVLLSWYSNKIQKTFRTMPPLQCISPSRNFPYNTFLTENMAHIYS